MAGCDYESPFEALRNFIISTSNPASPNFDFLRDGAIPFIIFVGDEDDCSLNDPSILDPAGDRAFWPSSATGQRAPSAVCFRAGVSCSDEGDDWNCEPADRLSRGPLTSNPDDAALVSVQEMVGFLQALEDRGNESGPNAPRGPEVIVSAIGGFTAGGHLVWPKEGGPAGFVEEFGVGPGCGWGGPSVPGSTYAAPPARISALAEAMTPHPRYSSCDPEFSFALEPIVPVPTDYAPTFCFDECAELGESSAPQCRVVVEDRYGDIEIPECQRDESGYVPHPDTDYALPEGEDICVAYLDDRTQGTPDALDDLSQECVDEGSNLEFKIARRLGTSRFYEGRYVARCLLDVERSICPEM